MLRVYLDQAKWIDLSKCRVGHPQGKRFQDVYALASEAVRRGHASFVLSCAHYYETQRRVDTKSRLDLADTMIELSRFHGIAPPMVIVPAEITQFLTGQPLTAQVNLFGVGLRHTFNTKIDPSFPVIESFPLEQRAAARERAAWEMERLFLAAPPLPNGGHLRMLEVASMLRDDAQRFVDSQITLTEHITTNKLRDRISDVSISSEIADFIQPLLAGCLRNGVAPDDLFRDRTTIQELLQSISSRWVSSELRQVRLRNPQQPWTKNDLNDILALSIAVPYCNVVVTERQWARHINQLGLAERYGTTVIHDLTELTDILVTASTQAP